jgi:hypothetical protein
VAPLPAALGARDLRSRLVAGGAGAQVLTRLGTAFDPYDGGSAEALLAATNPRLLVAGTAEAADATGLVLIDRARARAIVTAGVVDSPANPAYRFRGHGQAPLAHAPEWILVPDGETRAAFVTLGAPEDRVVACGHPAYDAVREGRATLEARGRDAVRRSLWPEAPGGAPVVVFLAEISDGPDPALYRRGPDYTLEGTSGSDGRTEIVLEEFLHAIAGFNPRPHLILRLHPKNTAREFDAYRTDLDRVSQADPIDEVIFAADLVVGMTSEPMLRAVLLGRPTLSILPREVEREWLPTIAAGITPCATSREAVRRELHRALGAPDAIAPGLIDHCLPAGATARVADLLEGLLRDRERSDQRRRAGAL